MIRNAQGFKNGIFSRTGKTNSPNWIWIVATQVTGIPFGLAFMKFLKR